MVKKLPLLGKNYSPSLLEIGAAGILWLAIFSRGKSKTSTVSNIPLKYGENYVKYNLKSKQTPSEYLEKISEKCLIDKKISNENDIQYIDLVKCILNKLNKQSYDKFINKEYNEEQSLLLVTILMPILHNVTVEIAKKNNKEVDQEEFLDKLSEKETELFNYLNLDFDDPIKEEQFKKIMETINNNLDEHHEYYIQ